jgi:UDP-N-acetylglucosamine 4-epimerase
LSGALDRALGRLGPEPRTWLVTGVAGFIGSHLLETLLRSGQTVRGLDNFSTGFQRNLDEVRESVPEEAWRRFTFVEGDIRDPATCAASCQGVEFVLHQAGLGSVPRSLADPSTSHNVNLTGQLNLLVAARDAGVETFVFASSSSVYGDSETLPKVETDTGALLSPYAVTKFAMELYGAVFYRSYGLKTIGLRYFNVFGPRQDPDSAYAAVIPKWTVAMIKGEEVHVNGDGSTTRDFCYVDNVIQANIAAVMAGAEAMGQAYNVSAGGRTSLLELFEMLRAGLTARGWECESEPQFRAERAGDIKHSQANLERVGRNLGYEPTADVESGIEAALGWYLHRFVEEPA